MSRTVAVLICLIIAACGPASAAPTMEELVGAQIERLNMQDLEEFVSGLDRELQELMPSPNLRRLIFEEQADLGQIGKALLHSLLHEFFLNSKLLGQLIILVVLCSLLQNLRVFEQAAGSIDLAFAVCFLVLTYITLHAFREAAAVGAQTIDQMVSFMYALIPVLSAAVAASGAVGSVTVLHPVLYAVVALVALAVNRLVFPLLFCAVVLSVVGNFSREMPVSRLAGLFHQATIVILSLGFTAFLGVMAVRGSLAPVADGVTLKTAKYLTGTFVPVIGKMFADSLETVAGGSLLIKSAIGTFGMVAIIVLVAFPLAKIGAILAIYKLVTALVQPISDERLTASLNSIGNSLAVMFAAVSTVAVMFFMCITILVGIGNLAVMVR